MFRVKQTWSMHFELFLILIFLFFNHSFDKDFLQHWTYLLAWHILTKRAIHITVLYQVPSVPKKKRFTVYIHWWFEKIHVQLCSSCSKALEAASICMQIADLAQHLIASIQPWFTFLLFPVWWRHVRCCSSLLFFFKCLIMCRYMCHSKVFPPCVVLSRCDAVIWHFFLSSLSVTVTFTAWLMIYQINVS